MIKIKREKWIDCIDEIMPMCKAVFNLEEAYFTGLDLDFDAGLYKTAEDSEQFHCLVMRKNGKAIGFHWLLISPMPRHKGKYHAHTDAIFVQPEERQYSHHLINYSEQYIQSKVNFWTLANISSKNNLKLWQRRGFQAIETIMLKKLGE